MATSAPLFARTIFRTFARQAEYPRVRGMIIRISELSLCFAIQSRLPLPLRSLPTRRSLSEVPYRVGNVEAKE